MEDEKIKLEEIEVYQKVSHTLGGVGEVVRGVDSGEGVDSTLLSDTLR